MVMESTLFNPFTWRISLLILLNKEELDISTSYFRDFHVVMNTLGSVGTSETMTSLTLGIWDLICFVTSLIISWASPTVVWWWTWTYVLLIGKELPYLQVDNEIRAHLTNTNITVTIDILDLIYYFIQCASRIVPMVWIWSWAPSGILSDREQIPL